MFNVILKRILAIHLLVVLPALPHAQDVKSVEGHCQSLLDNNISYTNYCTDTFIIMELENGRVNYTFMYRLPGAKFSKAISFAGIERDVSSEQSSILTIDRIYSDGKIIPNKIGSCSINGQSGQVGVTISCRSEDLHYKALFFVK